MITKLRKGILHREVITSQGVGPYSRNLIEGKKIYRSNRKNSERISERLNEAYEYMTDECRESVDMLFDRNK